MDRDVADLLNDLKRAFPAKRPHRFQPLVSSLVGSEPYDTARDFGDKDDWTALDPEWLDAAPFPLGSALSFLSDEAICFYIPAYMAADLAGLLRRVAPAFHLTHGFDDVSRNRQIMPQSGETWGDYAERRWRLLSADQVRAITHYLEWHIEKDTAEFACEELQALQNYWYPRASER
jgi:hypothetical protein